MEIHSAYTQSFASLNKTSGQNSLVHAQEETHITQEKSNTDLTPSQESKSSNDTTYTADRRPLTDDKAIKHAEQSLDEAELKKVQELKQRDIEVRAHEAAHLAAAGKYAQGAASFEYKRGPDGKSYAVGGEVSIDTAPIPGDPKATLRKAQQIQAAAHAPANPSAQDRQVAAQAASMAANARAEIAEQRTEGNESPAGSQNPLADSPKKSAPSDEQSATENQNKKANEEYQSIAGLTEDVITPILEQVA